MRSALFAAVLVFAAGCGAPKTESTSPTSSTSSTPSESSKPMFKNVVLTDEEDSKTGKDTFKVDTPKIYVYFEFENMPNGSKLKGSWVCEKSDAAPPNFKIDEATVEVGMLTNSGNFSLSKPTKGWPEGDYHVDLCLDDKIMETVKFKVSK